MRNILWYGYATIFLSIYALLHVQALSLTIGAI